MTGGQVDWSGVEAVLDGAERSGGIIGVTIVGPDGETPLGGGRWPAGPEGETPPSGGRWRGAPEGEWFSRHSDRRFRSASTVKIPIMIEVYRQIDRGVIAPEQLIKLTDADRTPGSSWLQYLHEGIEFTVDDLVTLMISISDNTATNMLIDLVGIEQVNATMRELGMIGSELNRKMKGVPPQPGQPENWATPDDYAKVIASILDGTAASAASCTRMIEMLTRQDNDRRIARYAPKTDSVRWGSKTGTIGEAVNDVGFIEAGGRHLILSVFCEGFLNTHVAEQVIGDLSREALIATGLVEPLPVS